MKAFVRSIFGYNIDVAFWEGVLAGYGIAVPVGAIAILIIEQALGKGFASGFAAGAGAATVDLFYAAAAVFAGTALIPLLSAYGQAFQIAAAMVLINIGGYGIFKVWRFHNQPLETEMQVHHDSLPAVYGKFIGLTLLNPLTIVYFAALIIGLGYRIEWSGSEKTAFLVGAGLASLSWQTFLAAGGAAARRFFSPIFRDALSLLGNLLVILLGVRIVISL